jgi:threonine dehydrogenase-like Zn-dependent dehydrogenase
LDPGQVAHDDQHIVGSKVGSARPQIDIPRVLSLYRDGRLTLDELVSDRYGHDDINDAIASGARGDAIRNIITLYDPPPSRRMRLWSCRYNRGDVVASGFDRGATNCVA